MLNYYYIYAGLWTGVCGLYALYWSKLNAPLDPSLIAFFVLSIAFCVIRGYQCRKEFAYRPNSLRGAAGRALGVVEDRFGAKMIPLYRFGVEWGPMIALAALFAILFVAQGFVPLVAVFNKALDYESLLTDPVPFVAPACIVGCILYASFCFKAFLDERRARSLVKVFFCFGLLMLQYIRSAIAITLFVMLVLFVARRGRISALGVLIMVVAVLAGLWLFGAMGNMRYGAPWSNSFYIFRIGRYTEALPSFVPRQFLWAYSYVTSPLACLNFNVTNGSHSVDVLNFLYSFMPMAIAKRLPFYVTPHVALQVNYFTVSSIWSDYFCFMGVAGIYAGFVIQMGLLRLARHILKGTRVETIGLALMSMVVAFSFFMNSFTYPSMAYPVYIVLAMALFEKAHARRAASAAEPVPEPVPEMAVDDE